MMAVSVRRKRVMATCLAAVALVAVCLTVAYGRVVFAPSPRPSSSKDVSFYRDRELVIVHTISRHGERTPADTFPTDPHINDTFYPYGWGSLTNGGRMQMYRLGQFLRSRYDRFLGDVYSEDATYAQSTGVSRARMSCSLILAGLWPPAGTALDWNPALNWQPIPVVSQELDEDMLLLVRKRCPRYNEALNEVLNSTRLRDDMAANEQLMQELTKYSGMSIRNYDDVQSLYNTLKSEEAMGIEIMPWAKRYKYELASLTAASFIINSYTDEMIRLKGGVFLKKLMSDWTAATSEQSTRVPRMSVYTGHDATVANIARALGVWESQVPSYGITLLLELYRDQKTHQYFLEVHLQNSTQIEPYHLTIPGCKQSCPIENVISLRQHLLPGDWQKECEAHDPTFEPPPPSGP